MEGGLSAQTLSERESKGEVRPNGEQNKQAANKQTNKQTKTHKNIQIMWHMHLTTCLVLEEVAVKIFRVKVELSASENSLEVGRTEKVQTNRPFCRQTQNMLNIIVGGSAS